MIYRLGTREICMGTPNTFCMGFEPRRYYIKIQIKYELFFMIIPHCTIENVLNTGRRRRSTIFIPRLRSAIALCTWGLCSEVEPEPRRGSTAATRFSLKADVHALEHLRRSGALHRYSPHIRRAKALLNVGIKKVEPLRGSAYNTFSVVQLGIVIFLNSPAVYQAWNFHLL